MKLPGIVVFACCGGILLYAVGAELAGLPPRVKAPKGVALLSWGDLAGTRLPDSPGQTRQGDYLKGVPRFIRGLDNQRVLIQGYMIPTATEEDRVRSFLLVRMQASCCFGLPPQLSDVLEVRMTHQPADQLRDRTVNVIGTLHVQEHWAGTWLSSLYQMDAESVVPGSQVLSMPLNRTPQALGLE
jgi:hypothetical protein